MPTLYNVQNSATSHVKEAPHKRNITNDFKSRGEGETGKRRFSASIKDWLEDSQDGFVSVVIWISTISVLAPILADALHKMVGAFTQTPMA